MYVWGDTKEQKCSEKFQLILIHIVVISLYSIGVNWNAVHCCACEGINFLSCRTVCNASISKNILKMSNTLPDFQGTMIAVADGLFSKILHKPFCHVNVFIAIAVTI